MSLPPTAAELVPALAALADGIIPPDERDAGASAVNAGPRIAERIAGGASVAIYRDGLQAAEALAQSRFGKAVAALLPDEIHELIGALRGEAPAFYKQLRMDVAALYLSDPGVWSRIGFPGPATASGGYPDFDRPQT